MGYTGQVETFFITIVTGALLGLLFDLYRIFRGVFKPRWVLTSLADLTYWLLATVIVFVALLFGNWGELRLYVFIGLSIGLFIYYRLFSRYAIRLLIGGLRLMARFYRGLRKVVLYTLVKPVNYTSKFIARPFKYMARRIGDWRKPPGGAIPPE